MFKWLKHSKPCLYLSVCHPAEHYLLPRTASQGDTQPAEQVDTTLGESSASRVRQAKGTKRGSRRVEKSANGPPIDAAPSLNTAEGSAEKGSGRDSRPAAARGSSRLKEKGKVVYSARRGVIKPAKRGADGDGDGERPRKRTAS